MTRAALLALAERVEKAEGPDREVVKAIARAIGLAPAPVVHSGYGWREDDWGWWYATGEDARVPPRRVDPPAWLTCLDAALTLVPEGAAFMLMRAESGAYYAECGDDWQVTAATPALALTAAALRARGEGAK